MDDVKAPHRSARHPASAAPANARADTGSNGGPPPDEGISTRMFTEVQGERVPTLGLGTWKLRDEECVEAVRDALEIGYRHVDTAQIYANEEAVGRGLRESGVPRDEIFLTTKVWLDNLGHDDAVASTEASLRKLGTEHVDLLLIHWPNDELSLEEPLAALAELQERGRARHIGVSNFTPTLLDQALGITPLFAVQVEYHPFLSQDDLLERVRERDMMLTAYSPIARGGVADDPVLREIGRAHGKSAAQVTLRWLVQQDSVTAIPKASDAEHRRSNFDIWDFRLTGDEMERIADLARGERLVDPDIAPDWEHPAD